MSCHTSSGASIPPPPPIPAFEQNKSMGPNLSSVCSTTFTMSASTATSAVSASAAPPSSCATACTASPSRSTTTTPRAPSAAKRLHSARPMPLPPPVTTATLSANSIRTLLSADCCGDRGLGDRATVGAPRHRHDHGNLHAGVGVRPHGCSHLLLVAHDVDGIDEPVGHRGDRSVTVAGMLSLADHGDVIGETGALEIASVRVDDGVRPQVTPSGIDAVLALADADVHVRVDRRGTPFADTVDRPRDV